MGIEQNKIVVEITKYGRARTVTALPTGLYCKIAIGRIDGEQEQEVIAQMVENLPPELFNAIFDIIIDDGVLFNDNLREIAAIIDESDED